MVFSILYRSLAECSAIETTDTKAGVAHFLDLALFIAMIVLPQFNFMHLSPAAHWGVTLAGAAGIVLLSHKSIQGIKSASD